MSAVASKLVTPPQCPPVDLYTLKQHLRVDAGDDDILIAAIADAATEHAERFLGRALIEQTWDIYLDKFPTGCDPIELAPPPILEVVGVFYKDADGNEQQLDEASYIADTVSEPGRLTPVSSWPALTKASNAVRVRVRAGYLNDESPQVENVPASIKAAIMLISGTLYENRETIIIGQTAVELPFAAEHLMRPFRVLRGMA